MRWVQVIYSLTPQELYLGVTPFIHHGFLRNLMVRKSL